MGLYLYHYDITLGSLGLNQFSTQGGSKEEPLHWQFEDASFGLNDFRAIVDRLIQF